MVENCNLLEAVSSGVLKRESPYLVAAVLLAAVVLATFVVSTISQNYSQVDKLWSILPIVYTWMAVCDGRTFLMACLATIWGVRLTFNFHRRGGYTWPPWAGDEDYRWEVIRTGGYIRVLKNPILWIVFNFGFISFFQNVLLLWIVAPSFVAHTMATHPSCQHQNGNKSLNFGDWMIAILILGLIGVESIADNQQYSFQTEKYRLRQSGGPLSGEYADGFCQSGLFSIVRKPHYAAEQSIWLSFYVFSVTAGASWWNWSGLGALMLVLLFQGSGAFTEKITLEKYPIYRDYMSRIPLYVPIPFRSTKAKAL